MAKSLGNANFNSYTPEAHHIIPAEIVNEHFSPKKKEEYGIYRSYDEMWNGIYLPSKPLSREYPESNKLKLPYHRRAECSHHQYTTWVKKKCDRSLNSDDSADVEAIHSIASSIRDTISNMPDNTCLDDIGANVNSNCENTLTSANKNSGETRHNPDRNQRKNYKDPSESDDCIEESEGDISAGLKEIVTESLIPEARRSDYIKGFFERAHKIQKAIPGYSLIDALSHYMDPKTKALFNSLLQESMR